MKSRSLWQLIKYPLVFLATILLAYFAAHRVRLYINKAQASQLVSKRAEFTRERLKAMGESLTISSHIANYEFWSLSGKARLMVNLVKDTALIIFIEPDCSNCESVIRNLVGLRDSSLMRRVFLITSGNPLELEARQDLQRLVSHILYDHQALYRHYYNITDVPAFVLVGPDLSVLGITFGVLTKKEIIHSLNGMTLPTYQASE